MKIVYAVIVGSVTGLVGGYFCAWLLRAYLMTELTTVIVGATSGGFVGAVLASIGGGSNKLEANAGSRMLAGFIAGAICGALGANRFEIFGDLRQLIGF